MILTYDRRISGKCGVPCGKPGSKLDWSHIDWKMQDVEVARMLGCSREAARQARPVGKVSLRHRKRTVPTALAWLEAIDTSGMTLEKAALLAGCEPKYAGRVLRRMKKAFIRMPKWNAKHDWSRFPGNWRELTDKQIAAVVGVDDPAVVAQWRNRHGYRKQVPEAVLAGKVVAS